jgi:integrase
MRRRRRKGGYPRLYQRPNGYWYIEYSRNRARSLKTRDKKEAAQQFGIEVALLRQGKLRQLDKVKRIRLGEFRDEYLAHRQKRLLFGEIAPSTLRADGMALGKLIDFSGDVPLRMINRKKLDEFKAHLIAGAKDVERRMRGSNVHLRHLRAAFNWAMTDDSENGKPAYIDRNPFASESWGRSVEFRLDRRLPRYFEEEELGALRKEHRKRIERVEAEAASAPEWRRRELEGRIRRQRDIWNMVRFYLYHGLRRDELVRLQCQDIKLDIDMIHVRKTKTRTDRYVPIPPRGRALIEEMRLPELGPVFPRWRHPDTVSHVFAELAKEAGISKTLHSTRHSYCSYMVMSGVDLRTIQKNAGHANIHTTMIYAKVSDGHRREETRKLSYGAFDEEEL